MTDRIPLDHLTSDQYDQLCDQLEALQAVARGYCPECGRGDAGPTAEDWERQRRRADEAEAQLRLVDAMRQQNLDAAAAAIQRAETAEAALARVRALHSNGYGLCDECTGSHGVPWPCPTVTALAEPGPATAATGHVYLSTGCWHGDHAYCQAMTGLNGAKRPASCKFCQASCRCGCHGETAQPGPA